MKRHFRISVSYIVILVLISALFGCGGKSVHKDEYGNGEAEGNNSFAFLEDGSMVWEDNALDDMHAVFNLPLEKVKVDGEIGGTGGTFMGEGGCVRFKTHCVSSYKNDWSGVNGITADGNVFSFKITLEKDKVGSQFDRVGPVSGEKSYVACLVLRNDNGKITDLCLYKMDDGFQKTQNIRLEWEFDGSLSDIMGDAKGYYHILCRKTNGKVVYVIVSSEGEVIFNETIDHQSILQTFGGGRVAVREQWKSGAVRDFHFYEADTENKQLRELTVSKEETVRKTMIDIMTSVFLATPVDEFRLLWCDVDGLKLFDSRVGKASTLYVWSNHGFDDPYCIDQMTVMGEGKVGFLYNDNGETQYLLLKATDEKKEVPSITMAVAQYNKMRYQKAVTRFNKMYPSYNIVLKDDWDETSLLTQLGAGKGPVLIDTELTGFEELEKLWQSLDGFLEQTGLDKEIVPEALEFGRIGENTYGVSTGFKIYTLITANSRQSDWDYEGFLNAMENSEIEAAFTYQYFSEITDYREQFFDILKNGLNDTFYFNNETGDMVFGTDRFQRVLSLSEKARKCPPWEENTLGEGRTLCEIKSLSGLWNIIQLRRRLEKNQEHVIGYPTSNGAKHFLVAQSPICLRSTATDEEKKIAYTFLKVLLSEEELAGEGFPVRIDALEHLFEDYENSIKIQKDIGTYNPNEMPELEEGDRIFFEEMLKNSISKKSFPYALEKIFDEEFSGYLSGGIDGKALSEHLKNRVWLYLEEQK